MTYISRAKPYGYIAAMYLNDQKVTATEVTGDAALMAFDVLVNYEGGSSEIIRKQEFANPTPIEYDITVRAGDKVGII